MTVDQLFAMNPNTKSSLANASGSQINALARGMHPFPEASNPFSPRSGMLAMATSQGSKEPPKISYSSQQLSIVYQRPRAGSTVANAGNKGGSTSNINGASKESGIMRNNKTLNVINTSTIILPESAYLSEKEHEREENERSMIVRASLQVINPFISLLVFLNAHLLTVLRSGFGVFWKGTLNAGRQSGLFELIRKSPSFNDGFKKGFLSKNSSNEHDDPEYTGISPSDLEKRKNKQTSRLSSVDNNRLPSSKISDAFGKGTDTGVSDNSGINREDGSKLLIKTISFEADALPSKQQSKDNWFSVAEGEEYYLREKAADEQKPHILSYSRLKIVCNVTLDTGLHQLLDDMRFGSKESTAYLKYATPKPNIAENDLYLTPNKTAPVTQVVQKISSKSNSDATNSADDNPNLKDDRFQKNTSGAQPFPHEEMHLLHFTRTCSILQETSSYSTYSFGLISYFFNDDVLFAEDDDDDGLRRKTMQNVSPFQFRSAVSNPYETPASSLGNTGTNNYNTMLHKKKSSSPRHIDKSTQLVYKRRDEQTGRKNHPDSIATLSFAADANYFSSTIQHDGLSPQHVSTLGAQDGKPTGLDRNGSGLMKTLARFVPGVGRNMSFGARMAEANWK